MANPLTGDFDAVVQVAVRQLNGLLATLHQNGLTVKTNLKLLHSVRVRVGDVRRRPPDVAAFGDWVLEYERARDPGPRPPVRDRLVATSPPGVARRLGATFGDLDLVLDPSPPDVVRGTASVQLSTVSLGVSEGSTSEVTVHVSLRARYEADAGTTSLPPDIHGEVSAAFEIRRTTSGGRTRLVIQPSPQDQKIQFTPATGSGMTGTDAARVARVVRTTLREGLTLVPVDLPEGFPFADFKALGSGGGAAIALPLQLSNRTNPPGGAHTLTQSLVGTRGFAFAVSRQHVESLIDVEAIRAAIRRRRLTFRISGPFGIGSFSVTYRLRFSSGPTVTFLAGAIEIAGRIEVETDTLVAPNGFVSFRQRLTLVLDAASQRVDLEAVGEPSVDQSFFIPHSRAVNEVKSQVASALAANAPSVRKVFQDAKTTLVSALRSFESSASATYEELEVSADGLTIRGDLSSAGRINPVMIIEETRDGRAFSAFESWIPGGRVDRFTWSWVEYPPHVASPWSGVTKSITSGTSFLLEKPAGLREVGQLCLRMAGERTLPDGRVQSVDVGTTCRVPEPVVAFDAPSWWEPALVPVWRADLAPGARLREALVAHVSVQTDRPRRDLGQNTLVVFPDWQSRAPFDTLARGLELRRHQQVAPAMLAIVPAGAFDVTRRELEARLAALPPAVASKVQVAEDVDGGWARTFDVTTRPALFLVNARREFAWQATGDVDPAAVAAALDQHLVPAPAARFEPHRLRVSVGDRAPDVVFRDDRGNEGALHRLLGRPVLLVFWHSSSEPSVAELRRVLALREADPHGAPFVVAFHGGAARGDMDEIRGACGVPVPIVQDGEHRVAQLFGVRCWPTTIEIGPDGLIERVQFGLGEDGAREAAYETP